MRRTSGGSAHKSGRAGLSRWRRRRPAPTAQPALDLTSSLMNVSGDGLPSGRFQCVLRTTRDVPLGVYYYRPGSDTRGQALGVLQLGPGTRVASFDDSVVLSVAGDVGERTAVFLAGSRDAALDWVEQISRFVGAKQTEGIELAGSGAGAGGVARRSGGGPERVGRISSGSRAVDVDASGEIESALRGSRTCGVDMVVREPGQLVASSADRRSPRLDDERRSPALVDASGEAEFSELGTRHTPVATSRPDPSTPATDHGSALSARLGSNAGGPNVMSSPATEVSPPVRRAPVGRVFKDPDEEFSFYFMLNTPRDVVRALAAGAMRSSYVRVVAWMLFTGVIPSGRPTSTWPGVVSSIRERYALLRQQYWDRRGPRALFSEAGEMQNPEDVARDDSITRSNIEKDVRRTCQSLAYFQRSDVQEMLTRVLFVWDRAHPRVGYKQGMNELLAMVVWALHRVHIKFGAYLRSTMANRGRSGSTDRASPGLASPASPIAPLLLKPGPGPRPIPTPADARDRGRIRSASNAAVMDENEEAWMSVDPSNLPIVFRLCDRRYLEHDAYALLDQIMRRLIVMYAPGGVVVGTEFVHNPAAAPSDDDDSDSSSSSASTNDTDSSSGSDGTTASHSDTERSSDKPRGRTYSSTSSESEDVDPRTGAVAPDAESTNPGIDMWHFLGGKTATTPHRTPPTRRWRDFSAQGSRASPRRDVPLAMGSAPAWVTAATHDALLSAPRVSFTSSSVSALARQAQKALGSRGNGSASKPPDELIQNGGFGKFARHGFGRVGGTSPRRPTEYVGAGLQRRWTSSPDLSELNDAATAEGNGGAGSHVEESAANVASPRSGTSRPISIPGGRRAPEDSKGSGTRSAKVAASLAESIGEHSPVGESPGGKRRRSKWRRRRGSKTAPAKPVRRGVREHGTNGSDEVLSDWTQRLGSSEEKGRLGAGEENPLIESLDRIQVNFLMVADPELGEHMQRIGVLPAMYLLRWRRLALSREFPIGDALLLWDAVIAETPDNWMLMDYLCVAMLLRARKPLLAAEDAPAALQVLTDIARHMPGVEAQELVDDALSLRTFGSLHARDAARRYEATRIDDGGAGEREEGRLGVLPRTAPPRIGKVQSRSHSTQLPPSSRRGLANALDAVADGPHQRGYSEPPRPQAPPHGAAGGAALPPSARWLRHQATTRTSVPSSDYDNDGGAIELDESGSGPDGGRGDVSIRLPRSRASTAGSSGSEGVGADRVFRARSAHVRSPAEIRDAARARGTPVAASPPSSGDSGTPGGGTGSESSRTHPTPSHGGER